MTVTSLSLLEQLRERPDDESWQRLVTMYTPLIHGWIRRWSSSTQDADDVVQEVFARVIRKMADFEHNDRVGAFRSWLRTITVNCLRELWGKKKFRPIASGGSDFKQQLDQLEDPQSELSREWNQEHDRYITRYLLELVEPHFSAETWAAFRAVAVEGRSPEEVATELGMTVNSIYIAKSRVLARLRQEGRGLIEDSKF